MDIKQEIKDLQSVRCQYIRKRASFYNKIKINGYTTVEYLGFIHLFSPRVIEYIKKKESFVENYHSIDDFLLLKCKEYINNKFWSQDVYIVEFIED